MHDNHKKLLSNPLRLFRSIGYRLLISCAKYMSDKAFLQCMWLISRGKKLNLDNPQSFNEKLQWLKLHNRKPIYTTMVDKYAVKDYVENIIGKEYIIPTLAVYNTAEDIDFENLPNQFVLKCTHDSGGIVICKDKTKLDKHESVNKLHKALHSDFYWFTREWPYKNVQPRIIAEQYISDEEGELKDYKFFCFNGVPKLMFVATDRFNPDEETKFDFFDMDYNHLPFRNGHPNAKLLSPKPKGFEKMKELAARLSKDIPHVRVDFYDIDGEIYFGELTFFHFSGFVKFDPEEWDFKLGEYLTLPND